MSQRKNYFIQKGLQSKFTLTLLLLIFLVAVICFCNLYVIGNFVLNHRGLMSPSKGFITFLGEVIHIVWFRLVLIIVVNVIIVAIIGIFYSHQFAGPSYKFEKSLKEIAQGDLFLKIYLRKSDSMHNVAEALNVMLDNFRSVIQKIGELTAQIKDISDNIKTDDDASEKSLAGLKGIAGELEDLLAGFKLHPDQGEEGDEEGYEDEEEAEEEAEEEEAQG